MKNYLLDTVKTINDSIEATQKLLTFPDMEYSTNATIEIIKQTYGFSKAFILTAHSYRSPLVIEAKKLIYQLHRGLYFLGCKDRLYVIQITTEKIFEESYEVKGAIS